MGREGDSCFEATVMNTLAPVMRLYRVWLSAYVWFQAAVDVGCSLSIACWFK